MNKKASIKSPQRLAKIVRSHMNHDQAKELYNHILNKPHNANLTDEEKQSLWLAITQHQKNR